MSVELIVMVFGIVLSLAAQYLPGFNAWYEGLDKQGKALFMLGFGALFVFGAWGLSCAGIVLYGFACTLASFWSALVLFVEFAIANQTTYVVAVRPFQK